MNDPVADSVRSLLDGHVVLARKLAEQGHYPAVDICQSVSRLMNSVTAEEHQTAARHFRQIYTTYLNNEDLINIGALTPGHNRKVDEAVSLIDRINEFLIQPSGTRSDFADTVARMREITSSWEALMGEPQTNGRPNGANSNAA
jgi:flagellum-specific ATP synthase